MTGGVGPSPAVVRRAVSEEFDRLRWVEQESDRLMEQVGIGPFPQADAEDRLAGAVAIFAAGDPAVGFVSVRLVDGDAHVDQLSVLPDHGGRGTGRALLDRAVDWARTSGHRGVTLTTFRDVPWNAPFYRRVGFVEVVEPAPGLAAVRAHEEEGGLDAMGPRVAMRLAF